MLGTGHGTAGYRSNPGFCKTRSRSLRHTARQSAGLFVAKRYLRHQMKPPRSVTRSLLWRLRLLATVLAVAGQLGLSGASLTLRRDETSAISHTERRGIDLHHGHNEATCAACTALSFHATVNPIAPPVLSEATSRSALASRALYFVTGPQFLPNSCRAPPREA
jgi:RNase P/RNase MRP subunit POP5